MSLELVCINENLWQLDVVNFMDVVYGATAKLYLPSHFLPLIVPTLPLTTYWVNCYCIGTVERENTPEYASTDI